MRIVRELRSGEEASLLHGPLTPANATLSGWAAGLHSPRPQTPLQRRRRIWRLPAVQPGIYLTIDHVQPDL
jgi:hypothetical protein